MRALTKVILIFAVLLTNQIFSQLQFTQHTITTSAFNATSVYAADIDGDGDMDVLSSYYAKIAWYENNGNEYFTTHIIPAGSGYQAKSAYAADVDNDGDMDLLSASFEDNQIAWYENDGNENFTRHTITMSAFGATSVYAIDVDNDGDMDVLSASYDDNQIDWYENDGNENFTTHTITTNASGATSVYAIDVDNDGDMDVLSASWYSINIAWYENDGNENFSPHIISNTEYGANSVYAIDVDGDEDIDVLSSSFRNFDDKIAWYENDGDENFTSHTITTNADFARDAYAVDLDGDEDIDVLSACSSFIAWYENDGNENFISDMISTSVHGATSVFAADVDGDKDMDVLSASFYDEKIAWYENLMPPVAYFGADTTIGLLPFTVQFIDSSRGGRTDWFWVFGDDSTSTEQYPIHTYIVADTFTVSLTVTGSNGSDIYVRENYIIVTGPTLISEHSEVLPTKFMLYNNYPNPFNPSTVIKYQIPELNFVTLKVYDVLGNLVTTLVNEEKVIGNYEVEFIGDELTSGIYFYRLQAGSFVETKKMVLMK
jgi:PKD repeat protein